MSCFFIPLSVILLSGISPDRIPAASGLSSFVRIVAGSFGTSIATTVWQDRAAMHHAQLVESVSPSNFAATQVLAGLNSAGLSPEQALAQVNRLVDQQSYMLAVNDVFYASALIFLLLIPVVWLSRPQRAGAASADAAAGAH
jgi:DHA2 family multidrug resistance protein